ncbi:hypothetical protein KKC1_33860 [Calderihabitans maritimus]|uniref:Uncharacterized protein n=1 Tax=Calderihabitans maritimus TaxID=1246530 RepID=A0A1Z5HXL8_9FIRM|nr:hypothetical protein KKC1_33860 [Calderihabitans maritimus]
MLNDCENLGKFNSQIHSIGSKYIRAVKAGFFVYPVFINLDGTI